MRFRKREKFLSHVEAFKGSNSDWYWRAISNNGRYVAISGEGYRNFIDLRNVVGLLFPGTKVNIVQMPPTHVTTPDDA